MQKRQKMCFFSKRIISENTENDSEIFAKILTNMASFKYILLVFYNNIHNIYKKYVFNCKNYWLVFVVPSHKEVYFIDIFKDDLTRCESLEEL